jgi:hypothetical protein
VVGVHGGLGDFDIVLALLGDAIFTHFFLFFLPFHWTLNTFGFGVQEVILEPMVIEKQDIVIRHSAHANGTLTDCQLKASLANPTAS